MGIEYFGQLPPWVLGTVSQSGGIPNGSVIEYGSTANGEYLRLAGKPQILWGTISTALAVVDTAIPIAFPAAMIDNAYVVEPALVRSSFDATTSNFNVWAGNLATTGFNLYVRNNAGFSAQTRTFHWAALGKWY